MKTGDPEEDPFARRGVVTEIFAGDGIEDAILGLVAAREADGVRRSPARHTLADAGDLVAGGETLGDCPYLVRRQHWSGFIKGWTRRLDEPDQLGAIHHHAAGHAQDDDVETDGQAGPQVDLKRRSTKPEKLRLSYPTPPPRHGTLGR